jgi:acyl dehydratase
MMSAVREGPEFSYRVEAAKIHEFAVALGGLDAIHIDRVAAKAAGYRDIVAPIGLIVWTIVQDRELVFSAFDLAADRGLAGSEGWEFLAPICAGDVLSGRTLHVGVERCEGRAGPMLLHRLRSSYNNQAGDTVLIENTALLQWQTSPFTDANRVSV